MRRRRWLLAVALLATTNLAAGADDVAGAAAVLNGDRNGDRSAAMANLLASAEAGNTGAAALVATHYFLGTDGPPDRDSALHWWQRAAAAGDSEAAFNAGLMLLDDASRRAQALELLEQAAAAGDVLGCFALGTALFDDPTAVTDDAGDRAFAALTCSAEAGYAPAQFNLARVLQKRGDVAAARTWYAAAATTFAPARAALAAIPPPAGPASQQHSANAVADTDAGRGPHGVAWVMARAPGEFTIQVGAGRDGAALVRMLERHAAGEVSASFLHRPESREPYSAVVGVFATRDTAENTLRSLPRALQNNAPWVRSFGIIQRELSLAERERE